MLLDKAMWVAMKGDEERGNVEVVRLDASVNAQKFPIQSFFWLCNSFFKLKNTGNVLHCGDDWFEPLEKIKNLYMESVILSSNFLKDAFKQLNLDQWKNCEVHLFLILLMISHF